MKDRKERRDRKERMYLPGNRITSEKKERRERERNFRKNQEKGKSVLSIHYSQRSLRTLPRSKAYTVNITRKGTVTSLAPPFLKAGIVSLFSYNPKGNSV